MSSSDKSLFMSSVQFLIELSVFLILNCRSSLNILEINPLSVASFAIIFCLSECCLLSSLQFPLLHQSFSFSLGPICLFLYLFPLL